MLTCSWDAEVYYVAWLRNGVSFYGEDLVRGVEKREYGSFTGSASVTADLAARWSILLVTDAFITDSANYTCAVTCRARQVVRGEVQQVSEEFSATREVLVLGEWGIYITYFLAMSFFKCSSFSIHSAVPDNLTAADRRPTYLVMEWTAPPSPFSGNYQLTFGQLGGMDTSFTVTGVSANITGLQNFTNYMVTVQANNDPVVEFGPPLSGVFATLPEATVAQGIESPSVALPQPGIGSSAVVEAVISPPSFSQDLLRYVNIGIVFIHLNHFRSE